MTRINRRNFIQSTAAASAAFSLFTIAGTKASGRVLGANNAIRVGVAGINGRGRSHIDGFGGLKNQNVEITYLIDPDSRLFKSRQEMVTKAGGSEPRCVADIREALDDRNLDAISVATCNHWHSLITVWSCQAGKDVYVEKPISHNISEGRKCVEAAAKYGRVVQHGTQQRSEVDRAREIAALQTGRYGKLLVSKGYACKPRGSIGMKSVDRPPSELDFNLWLGPAPEQPYHPNLVHYNWHWFWDTGNGEIGNQGVHQLDVARWAIKDATLPRSVWSLGGRFGYQDQGQTPNTQLAVYDFDGTLLVFEVRGLVPRDKQKVENEFYTTEGVIRDGKFYRHGSTTSEAVTGPEVDVTPGGPFGSFIQAMRTRKPNDNNANAEVAHYSSSLGHLGNISYRLGQPAAFDKTRAALGDNRQIVESFESINENLKGAGMKLEETSYMLGRTLQFDAQAERFIGDGADAANPMLTRAGRAPFIMPDQV